MNRLSKSAIMESICAGLGHEAYTHSMGAGIPDIVIDVTMCRRLVAKKPLPTGIELRTYRIDDVINHLMMDRVHDPQRVFELTPESWQSDPALVVEDTDGTMMLADGVHRVIRRHREGLKEFTAYWMPIALVPKTPGGMVRGYEWGDKTVVNGKIVSF